MKTIISALIFFILLNVSAQDHHQGKFNLGQTSSNQWYKLATFDYTGNTSYNSVIVNAEINFVRTTQIGYMAKVQLIMREGPAAIEGLWNYTLMGTQMDDAVKFKKVSPYVFELYAKSSGAHGHLSIEMSVTKEAHVIIEIPALATLIPDPNAYEDVTMAGDFSFISGNVGIGTWSPDSKLAVNGKVHAKEVKVDLIGWSDFVFEDNYALPSLKEVEQHIKEKGHLQDIPSAKEVEENGIYLGEMDAKLLQKIEELTLYAIEQEKKLKVQDQEIIEQRMKNKELEERLTKLEQTLSK